MKVTSERIPGSQVVLSVEVEPTEVEKSLERAYRKLVGRINVPGFRRGKAPRHMVERLIGKEALLEEALEDLVPDVYTRVIEEEKIEPIAQPRIEVTQREPVVFKATVPVRPEIQMGDYHQVREEPEKVEVTEEQVKEALEAIRVRNAPWEPVERSVAFDDLVTLDVESTVEGEPFWNDKDLQFQVVKATSMPVPGFSEALEGMAKGEQKEFTLTPPEDFDSPDLAGKKINFRVTVNEIKERRLPELNDDFAKGVGGGFFNLQELRDRIEKDLREQAEREAKRRLEDKVIKAVVELAEMEVPEVLVEREIDRYVEDEKAHLRQHRIGMEEYLRSLKKTEQELREELRPEATRRVKESLALRKLMELEGIEVNEDEVNAEIDTMVENAGERIEEMRRILSAPSYRESLEQMLRTRKTTQRLVDIATSSTPDAAASP